MSPFWGGESEFEWKQERYLPGNKISYWGGGGGGGVMQLYK